MREFAIRGFYRNSWGCATPRVGIHGNLYLVESAEGKGEGEGEGESEGKSGGESEGEGGGESEGEGRGDSPVV